MRRQHKAIQSTDTLFFKSLEKEWDLWQLEEALGEKKKKVEHERNHNTAPMSYKKQKIGTDPVTAFLKSQETEPHPWSPFPVLL